MGLIVSSISGCQPLVDDEFFGDPLYAIEGNILLGADANLDAADNLQVGIVWMGDIGWRTPERQIQSRGSFPARYTVELFGPPPDRTIRQFFDIEARFAIGRIVLFADRTGDGIFSLERDLIVGGDPDRVVLYVDDPSGLEALGLVEQAGFQIAQWRRCDDVISEVLTTGLVRGHHSPHRLGEGFDPSAVDVQMIPASSALESDLFCDNRSEDPCASLLALAQQSSPSGDGASDSWVWPIYQARCPVGDSRTREDAAHCLAWAMDQDLDPDLSSDFMAEELGSTYLECTDHRVVADDDLPSQNPNSESPTIPGDGDCLLIFEDICLTEEQLRAYCEEYYETGTVEPEDIDLDPAEIEYYAQYCEDYLDYPADNQPQSNNQSPNNDGQTPDDDDSDDENPDDDDFDDGVPDDDDSTDCDGDENHPDGEDC